MAGSDDEDTPVQVATQQHAAKFFFSLEDLEKHADSGKPRILDKTRPNMLSWIAFRLVLWFELVDRGNMWKTLHDNLYDHDDRIKHRHNAGVVTEGAEYFTLPDAISLGQRILRKLLLPGFWLTQWLQMPPGSNVLIVWFAYFDRQALLRFQAFLDLPANPRARRLGAPSLATRPNTYDIWR